MIIYSQLKNIPFWWSWANENLYKKKKKKKKLKVVGILWEWVANAIRRCVGGSRSGQASLHGLHHGLENQHRDLMAESLRNQLRSKSTCNGSSEHPNKILHRDFRGNKRSQCRKEMEFKRAIIYRASICRVFSFLYPARI